jgi:hypothetical protein
VGELQQALKDSSAQLSHVLHEQVFLRSSCSSSLFEVFRFIFASSIFPFFGVSVPQC